MAATIAASDALFAIGQGNMGSSFRLAVPCSCLQGVVGAQEDHLDCCTTVDVLCFFTYQTIVSTIYYCKCLTFVAGSFLFKYNNLIFYLTWPI